MGKVDGLIIPRSYNDYFSKSDTTALQVLLNQLNALPVDTVALNNMKSVTSNAVASQNDEIRKGNNLITYCYKTAGNNNQNWAKLFSFRIGRQFNSSACFFDILCHSINRGGRIQGFIGGYTQNVSNPTIWNKSDMLGSISLYYSKTVQDNGSVLIEIYVPTYTDNYMWWEVNLKCTGESNIFTTPDLITDVSGLTAFNS